MTMSVLQNKLQIYKARRDLINKGVSFIDSPLRYLMRRLRLVNKIAVGDFIKSWDVFLTLDFIEKNLRKDEPILDIGCYASEIIAVLHKSGYSNLSGVDLNQNLTKMPFRESIKYKITDFMHTGFPNSSFKAITSISVIEHGFNGPLLLKEVSRLLKFGGFFIASFDYFPEKINTDNVKYFDMDWKIFSKEEVTDFISKATDYGLKPFGRIAYNAKNKPINYGGKQYTFAWLVLKNS
jgi:SAM-dependent methyltransferase